MADIFAVTTNAFGIKKQFKDLGNGAWAEVLALEPGSIGAGGGGSTSVSIQDGVNAALKATVTASSALKVDGSAVTQPVSGPLTDAQLRASAVPFNYVSGGPIPARLHDGTTFYNALTDTQLRASAVPVSGTFFQATQPVSLATNTPDVTDRAARLLGHVTVDNASIPVTGTFFQATQPVSLATNTPDVTDRAARLLGHVTVDNATLAVTQSGTWTVQPGNTPNTTAWKVDGSAVTQPVSIAATVAENVSQWGGAATTLGQKAMTASVPVVVSSDQSAINVAQIAGGTAVLKTGSLTTTAVTADQVVLTYTVTAAKTFYLTYLVMYGRLTVLSATATILGAISLETPSGTKVFTLDDVSPTTSELEFNPIILPAPIPIAAGVVVRVVVTPAAATSMLWRANFGGYEKP